MTGDPVSDVTTAAGLAGFLLARYDEHIARCWERAVAPGSAFVRDEYEALRAVVELHAGMHACCVDAPDGYVQVAFTTTACETLRLLALPYAGHPDWREEWRA